MKKALLVGINYYESCSPLHGCVDDAHALKPLLERNGDGTVNFSVRLMTGTGPKDSVERGALRDQITQLFEGDSDIALFFFAGHGHIETTGGYLMASDSKRGDEGISLSDVLILANRSKAKNKLIILDSCHSGIAGNPPHAGDQSVLAEGMTILTASTADQYASENAQGGVFTRLLVDALSGSACNLVGDITPGAIYAHIDQSLGPWEQRPVFKTNVKNFVSLRRVSPPVQLQELHELPKLFPHPGYEFKLDPSFEPEIKGRDPGMPAPNPQDTAKFAILQRFNRVNLVVPVGAQHMWHAAMESRACKLTVLGEHYRRLVERKLI